MTWVSTTPKRKERFAVLHVEEHVDTENEQNTAAFMSAVVGSLEDSLITIDLNGRVTTWNHGAEAIYGYSAAEMLGKPLSVLILKRDQQAVVDALHRVASGEHVPSFRSERIRKDGKHLLMSIQLSPIRNENGQIIGASTLARDKTDEIHWREAIRESEARFRLLTESIPQLVWTCTPEGECDYVSPQWCDYTGMPVQEQLGRGWIRAVHPDDQQQMHVRWAAAVKCEQPFELEYRLRNGRGEYRWFQVRGAPVHNGDGRIVKWFGTCTDVEDRKRTEIELEHRVAERTAELRQTISQMEAFSYSLAHDLRAPLRAMSGFAQILRQRYGDTMDERGRQITDRISQAAERLDLLVVDVLRYSRVLREPIPLAPVDLDHLVSNIIATSPGWLPPRADVQVVGKLPRVIGHVGFLSQCVSNLVENAIKFVRPEVQPRVRIFGQSEGRKARLYVRDNGIGIAPENQQRIFKIFERIHGPNEYEGTGMGLAIVRAAAERINGRVRVESEPGKGSTFWLELQAAS